MKRMVGQSSAFWKTALLFFVTAQAIILYSTFSAVSASDGFRYVQDIEIRNWKFMLLPNHFLPEALIIGLMKVTALLGFDFPTLSFIQTCNVILSMAGTILSFLILERLGFFKWMSLLGSALFSFSYSLWYLANGEIHHFGVVTTLLIFLLLLEFRQSPSHKLAFLIGCLNILAMAFHEEHVLMCVPVIWMMLAGRFGKNLPFAFVYMGTCVVLGFLIFGSLAWIVYDVRTFKDFVNWFYVYHGTHETGGYLLVAKQDWPWIRLLKGTLMSFHYGAQILVDGLRYGFDRNNLTFSIYIALSTLAFLILGSLPVLLVWWFKSFSQETRLICGGLILWCLTYKLVVNLRFVPESPEYHAASLAPWLFLFLIPLQLIRRTWIAKLTLISLFVLTFSVNLFAGILPQKQYGEMAGQIKKFSESNFKTDDFFISSESGLDFMIQARYDHIAVKNLFLESSKEKGFKFLDSKIKDILSSGRRVFAYNLIPGKYALRGINFYNKGQNVTREDFELYFDHLKAEYRLIPVLQYWESDSSQFYLFNPAKDTLWEIQKS